MNVTVLLNSEQLKKLRSRKAYYIKIRVDIKRTEH
jgi:hypothetical protein